MRGSKYTRAVLLPSVQASKSITEVIQELGLRATGGNFRYISGRIRSERIDTAHFRYGTSKMRYAQITREQLEPLVSDSKTIAEVLAKLGLPVAGRPHRELTARIAELELDTRHLRGSGWSRGETRKSDPIVDATARKISIPDRDVFVRNSRYLSSQGIVRRLLARGWSYACRECGITTWRNRPLSLHLDHINGVHNDHRLVNLRFLCPNCHSQTATYCRRKSK